MKLKNSILVILFSLLLTVKLNAQTTSLFCTHNSISLGSYAFANCNLINDTITDNTSLPSLITSTFMSSTVDSSNHIYYFCDGPHLYGVNTLNNTLILNISIPLAGYFLTSIQYNPCDSLIYGVAVDYINSNAVGINTFNPADSSVSNISSIPLGQLLAGSQGTLDPINHLYIFELKQNDYNFIGGLDLVSGTLSFLTPLSFITATENFFGISYDCNNSRIIGISITSSDSLAYLTSVDFLSGGLTHISSLGWTSTINPFVYGGACVDHLNQLYYYTPAQNVIYTVDLNTGNLLHADTISPNALLGIELFSECPCPNATEVNYIKTNNTFTIYPNPATNQINFSNQQSSTSCEVLILNTLGEKLKQAKFDSSSFSINVSDLLPGIYFIRIISNENELSNSSFIISYR